MDDKKNLSSLSFSEMARSLASQIQEQTGIALENVSRMSRDLVRTMILQTKPDIPEAHLNILLDAWIPDRKGEGSCGKLPASLLRTMVLQFLEYSTGKMSEEQLSKLPDDWIEKYWDAFPADIRKLLRAYLQQRISGDMFIQCLETLTSQ